MNLSTENQMIAADLRQNGFEAKQIPGYNAIRVTLGKHTVYPYQVVRALENAGYEDCQYTVTNGAFGPVVRAVVA
jgi:hypothetical protein